MPDIHDSLVALSFAKPVDAIKPIVVVISIETLDRDSRRVDIELSEHQLVHLLSGTNVKALSTWTPPKNDFAGAIEVLTRFKDGVPSLHPDAIGIIRSIEVLRSLAAPRGGA